MKKPKAKPNGKGSQARRPQKAVGHTRRISALKAPVPHQVRSAPDRISGRRPAFDGAPNLPPEGSPETDRTIELGPITIDQDLAPDQLRELAELYHAVQSAKYAFDDKNDAAKVAKKTLESKTNLLLEKLRSFTHPTALPLFDQAQAEADQAAMTDGTALFGQPEIDRVRELQDAATS